MNELRAWTACNAYYEQLFCSIEYLPSTGCEGRVDGSVEAFCLDTPELVIGAMESLKSSDHRLVAVGSVSVSSPSGAHSPLTARHFGRVLNIMRSPVWSTLQALTGHWDPAQSLRPHRRWRSLPLWPRLRSAQASPERVETDGGFARPRQWQ